MALFFMAAIAAAEPRFLLLRLSCSFRCTKSFLRAAALESDSSVSSKGVEE